MAIFTDGFETGDMSLWTATVGVVSASADFVHHGSWSMKPTMANSQYVYKTFGSSYSTIYARFYFLTHTLLGTWKYTWVATLNAAGTDLIKFLYQRDAGASFLRLTNAHVPTNYDFAWTPTVDTWYCFEIECVRSAVAGEVHLWIDGVERISQAGLDTGDTDINRLVLGNIWGSTVQIYCECVNVDTNYTGPEGVGGVTVKKGSNLASTVTTMLNSKMLFSVCNRYPKLLPRRF